MDAIKLTRIREDLEKIAQGAVILPQVTTTSGRKKKKLSPEAVETIKQLQETPKDVYGRTPGSIPLSAATGAAVGTGLGTLGLRVTPAGRAFRYTPTGTEKLLAEHARVGEEALKARRMKARGTLALLGATGAGAGAVSNLAFQARRKHLQKKLEQELEGNKKTGGLLDWFKKKEDRNNYDSEHHEILKQAATEAYQIAKKVAPGGMVPARYLGERGMGDVGPELQERRMSYGVKRNYFNKKTNVLNNPSWKNKRQFKKTKKNAERLGMPVKKWDQQYNEMSLQANPFVEPRKARTATLGRKGEALGAGMGLAIGAAVGASMFKKKVPKPIQAQVVRAVAEAPKVVPKGAAGVVRELGQVPVGILGALGKLPGQMIGGAVKGVGKAVTPQSRFRAGVQGGVLGMGAGLVGGRVLGETAEQLVKRPDIPGRDPNQPTVPELLGMAAHSKAQKLLEE